LRIARRCAEQACFVQGWPVSAHRPLHLEFAASNEEIDPRTGDVAVQLPAWQCPIPLAPQVRIDALLATLAVESPLDAPLPGSSASIYDALIDCL
jgi:hypothetical protein